MNLRAEHISIRMVLREASFWNRGKKNLMLNNTESIKYHVIHFKNMDEQT